MARHGGHVVEPQPYHLATMLPQHDKKKALVPEQKVIESARRLQTHVSCHAMTNGMGSRIC